MDSGKFEIVKLVANAIAGAGVSKITHDIIRNNTDIETTADSLKVACGSIVIGSMVAERGSAHVNAKMDKVNSWLENRKEAKNTAE